MQPYKPPRQSIRPTFKPLKLSILDRIEFGVISAFFGLLVGGLVALIIVGLSYKVLGEGRPYNAWLVWFSAGYFFVVGVFRGAEVAETIVDGLASSTAVVVGGIGVAGGGAVLDGNLTWRRSMWWSIIYFLAVGLITWVV